MLYKMPIRMIVKAKKSCLFFFNKLKSLFSFIYNKNWAFEMRKGVNTQF